MSWEASTHILAAAVAAAPAAASAILQGFAQQHAAQEPSSSAEQSGCYHRVLLLLWRWCLIHVLGSTCTEVSLSDSYPCQQASLSKATLRARMAAQAPEDMVRRCGTWRPLQGCALLGLPGTWARVGFQIWTSQTSDRTPCLPVTNLSGQSYIYNQALLCR